jgi:hypothetical protein
MPLDVVLFTLLHLLVFAYWLGGDLGVFYSSIILTNDKRDAAGRIAAAKILMDVDLAPRLCLLLTLPTGLALASAKGWLVFHPALIFAAFAAAIAWIVLVLRLHVRHGAELLTKLDLGLRVLFLVALVVTAGAALLQALAIPTFIALKMLLLAFAISMGLLVRRFLAPFGPAYAKLASVGPDEATNTAIRSSLARARPAVMAIWAALVAAAWLGVATPV